MGRAILSLGNVNADFQMRAERPPHRAGTLLAQDLLRTSGGKAANVAVLARRLGAEVRLLGCVGDDDLAEQALSGPRRAGVTIAVRRASGPTAIASIVVAPDGDKTIVLALNANDWPPEAGGVEREVAEAPAGSVFVADLEIPPPIVTAAVRVAKHAGMTVVLDPAPAERVSDECLTLADHITPDHREAHTLTGIDASSDDGACHATDELHRRSGAAAYVKRASGGCALACREGTSLIDSPRDLQVVDTTGAGDAFAGALAYALLHGDSATEAASLAVAASACAVGAYGSQESYPSPDELADMRRRVIAVNR